MRKYTLKELCEELSISTATGRNWIKLNKIEPEYIAGRPTFSRTYIDEFKARLKSQESGVLKSRRNKKYISGRGLYDAYISDNSLNRETVSEIISKLTEGDYNVGESRFVLAHFATKLCEERGVHPQVYKPLVEELAGSIAYLGEWVDSHRWIKDYRLVYEEGEDILGLLYISCRHMGERKAKGAYYTPSKVVRELISEVWPAEEVADYKMRKVLDPSCGTGNFLIQLPDYIGLNQIYGADIDSDSVKITRLNLALRYRPDNIDILYRNIQCADYLRTYEMEGFDYIIGNPPWGYRFADSEKKVLKKLYMTAQGKGVESYDLFVEKSLNISRNGGRITFVLPESVMTVRNHSIVRELMIERGNIEAVSYLGEIFHKVQCPSVILNISRKQEDAEDKNNEEGTIKVKSESEVYYVHRGDRLSKEGFQLAMKDDEYQVLQKIYNCNAITLMEKATFAMGVVTGDNGTYLSEVSSKYNEPVIVGKDVEKYYIAESQRYIKYEPHKLQQVAPEQAYRAKEKLVYGFIGDSLRFAYDNSGRLTLNSCNILIPHIDDMHIKYILAVLNSSVSDFIYRKRFRSVKVLRSHIEELPIPIVNKECQKKIVEIVHRLEKISIKSGTSCTEEFLALYNELDRFIISLFGLNDEEYCLIRK